MAADGRCVIPPQIRNVETNQCLDNMARKENEKVGIFNCHGMGGNQVKGNGERQTVNEQPAHTQQTHYHAEGMCQVL